MNHSFSGQGTRRSVQTRPSAPKTCSGAFSRSARTPGYGVRSGAAGPGRDRARPVQQEREHVPLRGGERGCCPGQFPDPGVEAAAGAVCGVPIGVVTLVTLGPIGQVAGARPGCRSGSGSGLRR